MAKEKAVDRFAEMNEVLENCTAAVQAKVDAYITNQKRIHKDASKATFSALSDAQIGTMIGEVIGGRRADLDKAVAASILGAIKAE